MTRIAIVEDNADNRLLARALLAGLYECTEYESGRKALEGMTESIPSLVLLDVSLPGMDGIETLERLRALPALRHLPVIALTAHAMAGDRERLLFAGFDGYVTKPIVDETILLGAIARGLEGMTAPQAPA
jgi:CheY-like chemotaxis protein